MSLTAPVAREVTVRVEPPYAVTVGAGAMAALPELVGGRRAAVVTDENVAGAYGTDLVAALGRRATGVELIVIAPGEASKDVATYGRLLGEMARAGLGRDSVVVALGGGVVGDLAGFVAATYLRGVELIAVPTSLLAMVDSSVGGKTGIDLPEGKNLAGAFWQPRAVVADVTTLGTLPVKELRQGCVEVIKTGLIGDAALLAVAERQLVPAAAGLAPLPDPAVMVDVVWRSVVVKANIVARDPREAGERAHLNLGHTLGHALEAASAFAVPHGDAVLYGLLFASILARGRGMSDQVDRLLGLTETLGPVPLPAMSLDTLLPYLQRDKKAVNGTPRFVLLEDLERPVVVDDVGHEELRAAFREMEGLIR